ncbi:right-handed parallel beta-helix repeat-containing protein [Riemerella anatipestifer]|uniref:right-handed parallel beta-helix repeat-containing protein n=1 Tax=Riemerella anatipestifer TaxID=34085 RepID=UPI00208E1C0C|nr:right-handed parallel beta-helix repeat-containing protein [Riemerella anatipestifer]MCO4303043.1 right-handed parallel beta-helix repeat-containing protein [Riemerella anatipestifer]MCQ4038579.1 right-handed parallel beta-helix repeat-containing protein [Riemerella anatipestifer]MCT6760122.1 right-handed parallel beta-helix repeat-containing protein [Riemerella anatipestifer]MCT6772659.1 right-handed parallel beta-helix repeat-containing protein [Riemerella anatipestifer]MCU7575832.1 right
MLKSNLYTILVIFCAISFSSCQKFTYKSLPKNYEEVVFISRSERDSIRKTLLNPYNLVRALPKNYSTRGDVDYTEQIQNAIDEYSQVIFPNFPIMISDRGLSIPSNRKIYFNPNSKLILKASDKGQYEILRIHDAENVSIYFPNIIGDRKTHLGNGGEWGMGISIRGAKNILVYGARVNDCWGDGIYLGISPVTGSVLNDSIKVVKSHVNNNRRNGMSIITAQNLLVDKFCAANTSGTPPQAGIDIEPNKNTDVIYNLNFKNLVLFNNETHGFLAVLENLSGKTYDIGQINIKNIKVDTGYLGISLRFASDNGNIQQPKGKINIENFQFRELSRAEFLSYDENKKTNINVNFKSTKKDVFMLQSQMKNLGENLKIDVK